MVMRRTLRLLPDEGEGRGAGGRFVSRHAVAATTRTAAASADDARGLTARSRRGRGGYRLPRAPGPREWRAPRAAAPAARATPRPARRVGREAPRVPARARLPRPTADRGRRGAA